MTEPKYLCGRSAMKPKVLSPQSKLLNFERELVAIFRINVTLLLLYETKCYLATIIAK